MTHLLGVFPAWFWHPLGQCAGTHAEYVRCRSYNWWSGSASDLGELTLVGAFITGLLMGWRHVNCHEHGCPRLSWHKDKDGHPICKVHHPEHPARSWFRSDKTHPRHRRQKGSK